MLSHSSCRLVLKSSHPCGIVTVKNSTILSTAPEHHSTMPFHRSIQNCRNSSEVFQKYTKAATTAAIAATINVTGPPAAATKALPSPLIPPFAPIAPAASLENDPPPASNFNSNAFTIPVPPLASDKKSDIDLLALLTVFVIFQAANALPTLITTGSSFLINEINSGRCSAA